MADPRTIVATARPGSRVVGWKLASEDRERLLGRFPPRFPRVVADHVTLAARVASDTPLPDALPATVVGQVSDGRGVEALVVAIDGSTNRPDGSTYHLTWSLAADRRAQESNDVLKEQGWTAIAPPLPVTLIPKLLS